jgi:aminopeptidase N
MRNIFVILSFSIGLVVSSCGPTGKVGKKEYRTLDTITVSAKNNPLDIYRGSEPRYWDITHTRVALSFDMMNRTADGRAWIKLHPYFYATDTLVLDAKGMRIDSVRLGGATGKALRYTYKDDALRIQMDRKYYRGDEVELYIKYKAMPYSAPTGGSKAITDDRGLYFINTDNKIPNKPAQIWTQGETEANSHWLPTLDQPNERFTVQVELTVPDSFTTLSSGALVKSMPAGSNMRTDVWSMDKPIQTYAIMFAIGKFAVVQDRRALGKEVSYYVEPAYAPYAKGMFNNTPEMVDHFSTITGLAYPWNKYSQVVVRDYVSGAMENTTASLFGEFMNQNHREIADKNYEDVVSHELFHQWFGDYVTTESWSNLTLNESFANYGEQLWRRYKYGKASNDELAFEDLAKYLGAPDASAVPLVRFHYQNKEDMFDRVSYQKGGAILNYLHGLIGDSAFYRAMNIYLTQNALQPAEAHNWRMAVEEATGLDWNWFFNQWYYREGHPILSVQYDYDDKTQMLKVNVRQVATDSGKVYRLPLKAALIYGDKKEVIDWTVDSRRQSFSYPYRNGVRPVFVPDDEHWLVGIMQEQKKLPEWLTQTSVSTDYINKRRAVSSAFMVQSDSVAQEIYRVALRDSLAGIRTHALNLMVRIADKYKWHKNFRKEVALLAVNDPHNKVRAAAFDVLGAWKVTTSKQDMISALADSSYMVAGAALEALRKIDKDSAYSFTREILAQNPKADLENAAWNIISYRGEPADIKLFEERANYVYGTKKISFATYLSRYIRNTKDLSVYEGGISLLTKLAENEGIKSYRFAIGSMVFETTKYYKERGTSSSEKENPDEIKRRISIAEKAQQEILQNESDPENLGKYKKL